MLLTISTTHAPATALGFLLGKHPDRLQTFEVTGGRAHVFYPEARPEKCTAALLLEIDTVDLVRNFNAPGSQPDLSQYVNDRPFVASSFAATAISAVFSSAMNGRCTTRPELPAVEMPFEISVSTVRMRSGEGLARALFEPLGFEVEAIRHPLDELFPEWGEGVFFDLKLRKTGLLSQILSQLYVLLPVLDGDKHYFMAKDEVEKLLSKGAGWLESHPKKEVIARRFFKNKADFARTALEKLVPNSLREADENALAEEADVPDFADEKAAVLAEKKARRSLHDLRLDAVAEVLKTSGAATVLDLGCGEGRLIERLVDHRAFSKIWGMDVSVGPLQSANRRLRLEQKSESERERVRLFHGSLTYFDARLAGFDAAALVEVIEHLDLERLAALEEVVFGHARPKTVVVTTPNREFNAKYESMTAGAMRHDDHRFEWTRAEFRAWGERVGARFGYAAAFSDLGERDVAVGGASQMAVFSLKNGI